MNFNEQITGLEYSIFNQAGANALCTFSIAYEAWKLGMGVTYFKEGNIIKLRIQHENKVCIFNRSKGDGVTKQAMSICANKYSTIQALQKNDVRCPNSIRLKNITPASEKELLIHAEEIGYPLVLKPTYGSLGAGVFVDIQTPDKLLDIYYYLTKELGYNDIILENFFKGEDFRVYVIGNQVVGAIKRIPANVKGDGHKTIEQLIRAKNNLRKQNPFLSKGLIKFDKEIEENLIEQGMDLKTVLKEGEILYLRKICNASAGGDTVDVTDELSPEVISLAVKSLKAVPNLAHAGVDILISNFGEKNERSIVIEINSRAEIGIHLTPMYGKPRNIARCLIENYFSINNETNTIAHTFFSHKEVIDSLRKPYIQSVSLINRFDYGFIARTLVLYKNQITQRDINFMKKCVKKYNAHGIFSIKEDYLHLDFVVKKEKYELMKGALAERFLLKDEATHDRKFLLGLYEEKN